MNDRDRLIELLDIIIQPGQKTLGEIADHLLANGVIVPPCKVGDTVYQYGKKFTKCTAYDYAPQYEDDSECIGCCAKCDSTTYDFLYEGVVSEIKITADYLKAKVWWKDKWDNSAYEIGKTVFLTKEEAEEKLKELGK